MLIEQTLFGEINKEEIAIKRILEYKNRSFINKNVVAFSGGKDSLVLKHLCKRANLEAEYIYSQTSVDPPELIYYMRKHHKDVTINPYAKDENGNSITMWTLIPKKLMPPTRMCRYCCDVLKERTGNIGDTVFLGVRWAESSKRKKLSIVSFWKKKIVVRPIIDWSDDEIWEYINKHKINYCELYDKGFDRLGCIGCPLSSNMEKELDLYPKYKANYIRAFNRMIVERKKVGKKCTWNTGEEVMEWWTGKCKSSNDSDDQCSMF